MEDEQKIRIDASASSDQVIPEIVWENRFHDLSVVSTTAIYSRTRFFAARGLFERFRGSKIGESISGPLRYSMRKHMIGAIFWPETRSNEGGTSRLQYLRVFSMFFKCEVSEMDASASEECRAVALLPGSGGLRTPAEKCRPPG